MNKRILVIEDDYLIGSDIVSILRDAEIEGLGPVRTVDDALDALSAARCDAALIDVKLGHATGFAIARVLRQRAIPFAFISSSGREILPQGLANVPLLGKPFSTGNLVSVARNLCVDHVL